MASVAAKKPYETPRLRVLENAEVQSPARKDVVVAAFDLVKNGYQVVPLTPKTKEPYTEGWRKTSFGPRDFRDNDNIGIKSVGGVVDIDLDSDEVVELADNFLPDTGAIYGRVSKPRSHRLYRCAEPPKKTVAYTDSLASGTQKSTLIEIRVNHQSMAPPSVHPSGEQVEWEGTSENLGQVPFKKLQRSVRLVATAALIGRHYVPSGHRHVWILPLCGTLRHLGLTEDECRKVIEASGDYVKDDELGDRIRTVKDTYTRSEEEPLASSKQLAGLMLHGDKFVANLKKIWGTEGKNDRGFFTNAQGNIIVSNPDNIRKGIKDLGLKPFRDTFANKSFIASGENVALDPRHSVREAIFTGSGGVWPLEDPLIDRVWLAFYDKYQWQPPIGPLTRIVSDQAQQLHVHRVREYLDGLEWDKKPRIDQWLITYGGAADTEYVQAVGALALMAAVRRIRIPGCKFDELLVLESDKQGVNKSTALRTLCPNPDWFSDDLPLGASSKEIIEHTAGKWIIEAQELHGNKKAEADRLKSFLSRQVDGPVRLAYARLSVEIPRQFIVIGTTNARIGYLNDLTGGRRFWPVHTPYFKIEDLKRDRDQLWAEASYREQAGESIRLNPELYTAAGEEQEKRRNEDPWEERIEEAIEQYGGDKDRIPVKVIWDALDGAQNKDPRHSSRIAAIMQRLGFTKPKSGKLRFKLPGEIKARPVRCWIKVGSKFQEELDL